MDYLQIKNFPGIQPFAIWWKTIFPNFWPSFTKFWCSVWKIRGKKLIFRPFFTLILYNPEIMIFFQKSAWNIFFTFIKIQLCAKFQKNLMRGFPDIVLHTHAQTHGQTNNPECIGLPAFMPRDQKSVESPSVKKRISYCFWKCVEMPSIQIHP